MMATFSADGKMPDCRDEFMMERISLDTEPNTVLKNLVGIGSRAQVAELRWETALLRVSMSTGRKWFMEALRDGYGINNPVLGDLV